MKKYYSTDRLSGKMRRLIAFAMIVLTAFMFISADFAHADAGGDADDGAEMYMPIREAHKVKVGKDKYCFFVQNNVVMTPSEIAKIKDDDKLVLEILNRAGLYIKVPNCKEEASKTITIEDWIKSGKAFTLSEEDIESIRNAAPSDGATVRMHMDLLVAERPLETKKEEVKKEEVKEEETKEEETKEEEAKEEEAKKEEAASEDATAADATAADTSAADAAASDASTDNTTDAASADATAADTSAADAAASDASTDNTTDAASSDTTAADTTATDTAATDAAETDASADTGDKAVEGIKPRPEVPLYSTRKLFRQQLLYLIIATDNDVKTDDEECEDPEGGKDDEPEVPEPAVDPEPEEILPEYRTIPMPDRTGAKLEPTLADGKPFTLEWIEPGTGQDEGDKKTLFGDLPGGAAGPVAAGLALAGGIAALIRRRRRENEE